MSNGNTPWDAIGYGILAAASGLIGIVTGVKVHGVKISSIEDRFDRFETQMNARFSVFETKLDRMIERELER